MIVKKYTYKICSCCKCEKQETHSNYCKKCKAEKRLKYLGRERIYKQERYAKHTEQLAKEICLFVDKIVKRNHFCNEEELFQVITYFEKICHATKYDDVVPLINQICMMYRDLCRYYADKKTILKSNI